MTRKNEGVFSSQSVPVGGPVCQFVERWKRITNDPYELSSVAKGYRLRFTSPPLLFQTPWEIRFPKGSQKIKGMQKQISPMLQKNAILEISPDTPGFYSNIFLVHKASGGWHPVIDLKQLNNHINAPHFCMHTISSVLSMVERGQNRSAGCVLSCTNTSGLRKYLRFSFKNKVYQFQVLSFSLNTAPQVFTRLEHIVAAYLHCQGISVIPYLDNRLIHHPNHQVLLRHQ